MDFRRVILLALFTISSVVAGAQDLDFGLKGGVNKTFFTVNQQSLGSYTTTETGFYGGIFVEFHIDGFLSIQPEALYISVGDFNFLNVPLYAKYEVANRLHLLAGPSLNYFFDFFNKKLKVGADIGTSYDITSFLDVHLKFALGIDELAPNGLFFGVGLKL